MLLAKTLLPGVVAAVVDRGKEGYRLLAASFEVRCWKFDALPAIALATAGSMFSIYENKTTQDNYPFLSHHRHHPLSSHPLASLPI